MDEPEIIDEIDILVVDENEMLNFVMSLQVQLAGFAVRSASNGGMALRMISERLPGVLILDTELPDLSGRAMVFELRKSVLTKSLPTIIHTTFDLSHEEKADLCLGPTIFMTKTIAFSEQFEELFFDLLEQASIKQPQASRGKSF